jgi:hypothetical protein
MSGILKNEYSPDVVGLLGGGLLVAPFGGLSVAKDYKKLYYLSNNYTDFIAVVLLLILETFT